MGEKESWLVNCLYQVGLLTGLQGIVLIVNCSKRAQLGRWTWALRKLAEHKDERAREQSSKQYYSMGPDSSPRSNFSPQVASGESIHHSSSKQARAIVK